MEFPIEFTKCPACGCLDTVTRLACEEEMEKGIIPKGAHVALETSQIPLIGSTPPKLSCRVLIASWDICAECGQRYCTRVQIVTQPVQVKMQNPPAGFPGNFPGGKFPGGFPPGTHPGFG